MIYDPIKPATLNGSTARLRVLQDLNTRPLIENKYSTAIVQYITETMCFELTVLRKDGIWILGGPIKEMSLNQPPKFTGLRVVSKL